MIAILLSTYNGEKYLNELLQSLVSQSYSGFKILIRDDGSSDATMPLLRYYEGCYPELVMIFGNENNENLGVKKSFEYLMNKASNFQYFAFCDQDDVWLPDKLSQLVYRVQEVENDTSLDFPVLIFSDMEVFFQKNRKTIKGFYANTTGFCINKIDNGLFQGYISGCTMLFNKAAYNNYFKIKSLNLHDYDLFISVYFTGKIIYYTGVLLKYRIHNENYYGISNVNSIKSEFLDVLKFIFNNKDYREIKLRDYYKSVENLENIFGRDLCRIKKMFNKNTIDNLTILERKKWFVRHFLPFSKGIIRGVVQIALI